MSPYTIYAEQLNEIQSDGTQIDRLNLTGLSALSSLNLSTAGVLDFSVRECSNLTDIILTGSTSLRKIHSSYNGKLVNVDLSSSSADSVIVEYCANLASLNTSNCAGMTHLTIIMTTMPSTVVDYPRLDGCQNLRSMYLNHLPTQSLDLTAQTLLDSLDISYCYNLKDLNCSGLTNLKHFNLVEGGSNVNLSGCTSLKELDLEGDYLNTMQTDGMTGLEFLRIQNASSITSLSIPVLPNLQEIQLNSMGSLSSLSIAEGNAVKRLRLYDLQNLNYNNLAINSSSSLEQLYINYMAGSTEFGEYALDLSGYSALKLVNIESCEYLKDVSFSSCSSISKLHTKYCSYLTDINIDGCSSLTELDLTSTGIGTDMAIYVLEALPDNSATSFYSFNGTTAGNSQDVLQDYISKAMSEKKWYMSQTSLENIEFDFRD